MKVYKIHLSEFIYFQTKVWDIEPVGQLYFADWHKGLVVLSWEQEKWTFL